MGRGRTPGFKMPDSHRTKIANSKILNRLIEFAEGKDGVEMKPHQVTAALGLLRKIMPDMTEGSLDLTNSDGSLAQVNWEQVPLEARRAILAAQVADATDTDAGGHTRH